MNLPLVSHSDSTAAESTTVVAIDGCPLNLRTLRSGNAGATPVIFVHALAMNGEMWADVAAELNTSSPLYALDCRGHGASGRPAGPYTTKQFALDIEAVIDHLGVAQAHVVGCSMGGTVALAFAGLRPQRIASLSIVDATACYGVDVEHAWEERGHRALKEGFAAMVPFQLSRWFSDAYVRRSPEAMKQAIAVFLRNSADAYLESCRMLGRADEREGLGRYRGPAAVVVGDSDYATPPSMAAEIAKGLPDATLTVLPGLRHYTPIEAPKEVAAAISSVMQRVRAKGAKDE